MKIKTLTSRISIVVVALTVLVLLATISTVYVNSRNSLEKQAEEETQYKLDLLVQSLSTVQASIESAATYSIPALSACMQDTATVMNILMGIVDKSPYINSASVAYAPDCLPGRSYCLPIAVNYGCVTCYYGNPESNGDYIYNEWYMVPAIKGESFWTDPYSNELDIPVVSYAAPISNQDNKCQGVLTLSIELSNFVDLLHYQHGDSIQQQHERNFNVLLDRNTYFLTTPHTEMIMNETLFTLAESFNDTIYSHVGKEIAAGHNGQEVVTLENKRSVVTWRVLPKLQWTALVVTPYEEFFARLHQLTATTVIVALMAVMLAVIVLVYSVRHALQPLKRLQSATHQLGEGKYDISLPENITQRSDEIGTLGREFMRMEKAVRSNVQELEDEKQRVKENNSMLTNLIRNVVTNLKLPINDMIGFTEGLATMVDNSHEAQVIKTEAYEAGKTILQQFRQLDEMAGLVAAGDNEDNAMICISSGEFITGAMNGARQLEERFFITLKEEYHDKRQITIRTNPLQLETLIYQLIIEVAMVSNNTTVRFYTMLTQDGTALRFLMEAETSKPIPAEEKVNFFKRFAEQQIDDSAESDYLQLYICYRTSKQLGTRLYVDTNYTEGNRFVLEIQGAPKGECQQG